ncbi:hypothetical protein S7335_2798 [Synechococcus sp. PCC 7335]|nr:hypothetical protein S7335_2798 [Synechococcus sp. PCC 7335]
MRKVEKKTLQKPLVERCSPTLTAVGVSIESFSPSLVGSNLLDSEVVGLEVTIYLTS